MNLVGNLSVGTEELAASTSIHVLVWCVLRSSPSVRTWVLRDEHGCSVRSTYVSYVRSFLFTIITISTFALESDVSNYTAVTKQNSNLSFSMSYILFSDRPAPTMKRVLGPLHY